MFHECPNCRASVPFPRSIWLTAWGSYTCKACGSVLGVSLLRRRIAGGIWILAVLVAIGLLRLSAYGSFVAYGVPIVLLVAIIYLCEKVVVLDRRAFTCKKCGYDLQGLIENRCPECWSPSCWW